MGVHPTNSFAARLMAMLTADMYISKQPLWFTIFLYRVADASAFEAKQKMTTSTREEC
jgi:hypothetical protein